MRWHNGPNRRSQNPNPVVVFQDCLAKWEESAAHSILARSTLTPLKAVYICANHPVPLIFRLHPGGGPYIPYAPSFRWDEKGGLRNGMR
jgi:hypothetical protein